MKAAFGGARRVLIAAVAGLVIGVAAPAGASPIVLVVPGFGNYTVTGLFLPAGTQYSVTATGLVNLSSIDGPYITDPDGTIVEAPPGGSGSYDYFINNSDPNGVPPAVGQQRGTGPNDGFLVFDSIYGRLGAGFMDHPVPVDPSSFFDVFASIELGSAATFTSPGGFLVLGVVDFYGGVDNTGQYIVTIDEVPVPVPAAGSLLLLGLALAGTVHRRRGASAIA